MPNGRVQIEYKIFCPQRIEFVVGKWRAGQRPNVLHAGNVLQPRKHEDGISCYQRAIKIHKFEQSTDGNHIAVVSDVGTTQERQVQVRTILYKWDVSCVNGNVGLGLIRRRALKPKPACNVLVDLPREERTRVELLTAEKPEHSVHAWAEIAGLSLELVDDEWVTLRSLFEPFGKRVDTQMERLSKWADIRKFRLPSRRVDNDFNRLETWTIHRRHAAQAIGELDVRGMTDDVMKAFLRFKRECADALTAYFTKGVAVNPRWEESALSAEAFKILGWKAEQHDRKLAEVAANFHDKADRSEVMAVRADVMAVRAEIDGKIEAKLMAQFEGIGRQVATATGGEVAAAANLMTAGQMLKEAGIPWESSKRGPRFAPIIFTALRAIEYIWIRGEKVPREVFERTLPLLNKAKTEFLRLGWQTANSGMAQFVGEGHRHTIETLLEKMTDAMRVIDADGGARVEPQGSLSFGASAGR